MVYSQAETDEERLECLAVVIALVIADFGLADDVYPVCEKFENGGILALLNVKDETGAYLWDYMPPASHPDVAAASTNLGTVYMRKHQFAKAESLYQQALAITEQTLGLEHRSVAIRLNNLAGLYSALGDYTKAAAHYERAHAISRKTLGTDHPSYAQLSYNLAGVYVEQGRVQEPLPLLTSNVVRMPDARAMATKAGVTINGLAIVKSAPDLYDWYVDVVMSGPGAFVLQVKEMRDFGKAFQQKLLRELQLDVAELERHLQSHGLAPEVL